MFQVHLHDTSPPETYPYIYNHILHYNKLNFKTQMHLNKTPSFNVWITETSIKPYRDQTETHTHKHTNTCQSCLWIRYVLVQLVCSVVVYLSTSTPSSRRVKCQSMSKHYFKVFVVVIHIRYLKFTLVISWQRWCSYA